MSTNDGGPAFPTEYEQPQTGMSLLDWFAGQAPEPGIQELAGVMGVPESIPKEPFDLTSADRAAGIKCVRELYADLPWKDKIAVCAAYKFAHAAAMLAERSKRQ